MPFMAISTNPLLKYSLSIICDSISELLCQRNREQHRSLSRETSSHRRGVLFILSLIFRFFTPLNPLNAPITAPNSPPPSSSPSFPSIPPPSPPPFPLQVSTFPLFQAEETSLETYAASFAAQPSLLLCCPPPFDRPSLDVTPSREEFWFLPPPPTSSPSPFLFAPAVFVPPKRETVQWSRLWSETLETDEIDQVRIVETVET